MPKVFNRIMRVREYINLSALIIVRYCAWFRFETFYCGVPELVKFRKLGEVYKTRRYAFKKKRIILIIVCYPKDLRLPTHFVGF